MSVVGSAILTLGCVGACGDDHGGESFENLPDCVVDHMSLGEAQSVAHCLVDFPDLHPTFADQAACEAWVADNGGYPDSREAACITYFVEIEAGG